MRQSPETNFSGLMSLLLPETVAVATISIIPSDGYRLDLFPEEALAIRGAVERRQMEFAAGRWCARAALQKLGGPAVAIGIGQDRAPLWPDGFVGSISHGHDLCCAAVARRSDVQSLGIDVESAEALEPDLERIVCTEAERAAWARLRPPGESTWSKIAFVAKEAYYKCYASVTRTFLEFHDVSVDFAAPRFSDGLPAGGDFSVRLVTRPGIPDAGFEPRGRWMVAGGLALAAVAASPPKSP